MTRRFRDKNRNSFWNRILSCTALILYSFALIALPVIHVHGGEHYTGACCEHSHSVPAFDSGDVCPICEFAHLTVPLFTIAEPLPGQVNADRIFSISDSVFLAVHVADLPPCRASPVLY